MTFVIVLVVAFSAFVLGYCIGGADRDDMDDQDVGVGRTLEELKRIHRQDP
jgi:hypothetical protein